MNSKLLDYRVRFVVQIMNLLTDFLNHNSEWFKEGMTDQPATIYDEVKNCAQKVRMISKV